MAEIKIYEFEAKPYDVEGEFVEIFKDIDTVKVRIEYHEKEK
jgi:hypothetical protein